MQSAETGLGMDAIALSMEGISKRFPGTLALDGVSLDVRVGEVHALMGENGAGKSTLMKILTGVFDDYSGRIRIGGREARLDSPGAAKKHGIGMVYQELSLARPLSIAENVLVGRLPCKKWGILDRRAVERSTRHCLAAVGLKLNPWTPVDEISQHEAQLVEIAKVLGNVPCILILDEPTSSLSRVEVERLFRIIRDLRRRGLAIIYISHHLQEVFQIADRVTVLRDGRRIGTREVSETTPQELVQMMVGQSIERFYSRRTAGIGEAVLGVSGLTRHGFFHDVSFELRRGEIVGLAGLSGAGRSEVARALCGLDRAHCGQITLRGIPLELGDYPKSVSMGLVYLSEDRKKEGLFLRLSVETNLLAASIARQSKAGLYNSASDASIARRYQDELSISAASLDADAGTLSGGNQQKVMLGKWLATEPSVLILDEPSRGVDVRAKQKISETIMALADQGAAILLISSDLTELVGLSDRVLVLRNGRVTGALQKEALTEEAVLLAVNGQGADPYA